MGSLPKRRLGDLLREMDMISEPDLKRALELGKSKGLRVGEALIELGIVSEDQLLWVLAEQMGLSFIQVSPDQVQPEAVRLVPAELARRRLVLPLMRIGPELTVAVNDPLQEDLFADLKRLTGCEIHLSLARAANLQEVLERVYGRTEAAEAAAEPMLRSERYSESELKDLAADRGARRLLERLVQDAIAEGVNMIHLDLRPEAAEVRFREGGALRPALTLDPGFGRALVTRLAILGGVQDQGEPPRSWRVEVNAGELKAALEVYRLPVRGGETVVLRVLGKRAGTIPLAKLGLTAPQRARVEAVLGAPGLVVITGPADSGRATTVMSLLDRFDTATHALVTAEDWVRTEHPGHLQVMPGAIPADESRVETIAGLDPDVIYVENLDSAREIEAAFRAGIAGTFVFTLMGFKRAGSALGYLCGQDLQPALVAEGLSGIIAQRLLRRLCDKCKVETSLKKAELGGLRPELRDALLAAPVFRAKGCRACHATGYSGREAVFEVLALDEGLRQAVAARVPLPELVKAVGKQADELPELVLQKIRKGSVEWTEILAFR